MGLLCSFVLPLCRKVHDMAHPFVQCHVDGGVWNEIGRQAGSQPAMAVCTIDGGWRRKVHVYGIEHALPLCLALYTYHLQVMHAKGCPAKGLRGLTSTLYMYISQAQRSRSTCSLLEYTIMSHFHPTWPRGRGRHRYIHVSPLSLLNLLRNTTSWLLVPSPCSCALSTSHGNA